MNSEMAWRIRTSLWVGSTSASPSAKKIRRTLGPWSSPQRRIICMTSPSSRALNFFCGAVYISQNMHLFQEQPSVTGRISESASLGGRNTGSTYRIGSLSLAAMKFEVLIQWAIQIRVILNSLIELLSSDCLQDCSSVLIDFCVCDGGTQGFQRFAGREFLVGENHSLFESTQGSRGVSCGDQLFHRCLAVDSGGRHPAAKLRCAGLDLSRNGCRADPRFPDHAGDRLGVRIQCEKFQTRRKRRPVKGQPAGSWPPHRRRGRHGGCIDLAG